MKAKYKVISLDRIIDPDTPLRSDLSPESVSDLTESIKAVGVLEPLIVKGEGDNYRLIAGQRRLVAAGIVGLTEIPCMVTDAQELKGEMVRAQENLARADINPIDWAHHLATIKKQSGLPNAKLAKSLGVSEAWIAQHLLILEYDALLLEALQNNLMSFSSARELAAIKNPRKREVYINHAIKGGVTPTLAARWRKEANREEVPPPTAGPPKAEATPKEPEPAPLTTCRVCGQTIADGAGVRLTVHEACQPKEEVTPPKPQ